MGIRTDSLPKDDASSGYASEDYDGESDARLGKAGKAAMASEKRSVFSEDILRIEICGPSVDYLTVIDVPGIFRNPTEGVTTKEDMALVRKMVEGYIKDTRTIILAVLPCNIDIANQEILTLAEEYDKEGERTLGILTKPDLVLEQSSKAAVCSIVLGKKKQLALGYYVVRSRGADQDDAEYSRREEIFEEEPWRSLPRDRVGVRALKARLGELLGDIARREFPKLRKEVDEMLQSARKDLQGLGPSRKDEHEQRMFLSGIAQQFQDKVREGLEVQYASDDIFEGSSRFRLVTQIVNLAEEFNQEFQSKGVLRQFEELWREDTEEEAFDKVSRRKPAFADTIDLDEFPDLTAIISDEGSINGPMHGIIEWLDDLNVRSRGMDLGMSSNAVYRIAFKEQSSKWLAMSKAFMSRVIVTIHRFITGVLQSICRDERVRGELWAAILDELLKRYEAGMRAAEFLVSAERDTRLYTLDQRFYRDSQMRQTRRLADLLQSRGHDLADHNGEDLVWELQSTLESKSHGDRAVERIHDVLGAYFEIARTRFVDNLVNQAVSYHLLFGPSTPLGVLSQEWVIGLRAEQLEAIAGESPSTREQRERLGRKIEDLSEARKILRS